MRPLLLLASALLSACSSDGSSQPDLDATTSIDAGGDVRSTQDSTPRTDCSEGYEQTDGGCINTQPCSATEPDGRCPVGASCDGKLGYCVPDDPTLPCVAWPDWHDEVKETPICRILHDEQFLLQRTGSFLEQQQWLPHFEAVWKTVDQSYGAFAASNADWEAIGARYRTAAKRSSSSYNQVYVLSHMLAELADTHTGYLNIDRCGDNTALSTRGSPWPFAVVEVEGELYVYFSADDRVKIGDRVVAVNGLAHDALWQLWRERLKCSHGFSSPSIEKESFEASVLALAADPLLVGTDAEPLLGLLLQRGDEQYLLRPSDADATVKWSHISFRSYYEPGALIALDWEPYDTGTWGGGQPSRIGHGKHGQIAVALFYDFTGEEDLERAMRAVFSKYEEAIGWIIDIRVNSGGGPHEQTLTSFFTDKPVNQPSALCKNGPAHSDLGDCGVATTPIQPDDSLKIRKPVAVLTGGLSISAADYFAYYMKQVSRARLFGQPTAGAFGNISVHSTESDPYSLVITWTEIYDQQGKMQGRSVVPHEQIDPTVDDILQRRDPVMEAAVKWVQSMANGT